MLRQFVSSIALSALLWTSFAVAAQATECPGAPAPRLIAGQIARVLSGDPNSLRDQPTTAGERIGQIPADGRFAVLDGPRCADGFAWWQVEFDGLVGWTAEGSGAEYWVEPLATGTAMPATAVLRPTVRPTEAPMIYVDPDDGDQPVTVDGQARVNTDRLRLRAAPRLTGDVVDTLVSGALVTVIEGPVREDGYLWWRVETGDGVQGWAIEGLRNDEGVTEQALLPLCPYTEDRIAFVHTQWIELDLSQTNVSIDDLYTVDPDGGNLCNLTGYTLPYNRIQQFAWSPDGSMLAFRSGHHIYTTRADGSDIRRITAVEGSYASLSWSPDGRQLAYIVLFEGQSPGYEQVWAVNADGTSPYAVTTSSPITKSLVAWSPDGERLVYVETDWGDEMSAEDDASALYTIGSRGGAPERLAADFRPGLIFSIDWAPNAPVLAVCAGHNLYHCDGVRLINLAGQTVTELTEIDIEHGYESPAWSPDGTMIAYWANVGLALENGDGRLMVIQADGSDARELASGLGRPSPARPPLGIRPEGILGKPAWSPDSAFIAYSDLGAHYIVDVATGERSVILDERDASDLAWQPAR